MSSKDNEWHNSVHTSTLSLSFFHSSHFLPFSSSSFFKVSWSINTENNWPTKTERGWKEKISRIFKIYKRPSWLTAFMIFARENWPRNYLCFLAVQAEKSKKCARDQFSFLRNWGLAARKWGIAQLTSRPFFTSREEKTAQRSPHSWLLLLFALIADERMWAKNVFLAEKKCAHKRTGNLPFPFVFAQC